MNIQTEKLELIRRLAFLENVINYLEDNWTHSELNKFSKKLDKI